MLSIKNLEAGCGKVKVLHGISMEVPKAKVVTLIGSNGAGKTTTMRALSGMIRPTAGEVTLGGSAHRRTGIAPHRAAGAGALAGRPARVPDAVGHRQPAAGRLSAPDRQPPQGDVQADLGRAMDLFRA